jgi:hypothetical protein
VAKCTSLGFFCVPTAILRALSYPVDVTRQLLCWAALNNGLLSHPFAAPECLQHPKHHSVAVLHAATQRGTMCSCQICTGTS